MDGFNEQIVAREKKPMHLVKKILAIAALVFIPVLGYILGILVNRYIFIVGIFLTAFGIYGVWYIFTSMNVEYEYSVASGELEVAKVMSKRRRKKLCDVKIRDIESFGKGEKIFSGVKLMKVFEAAGDIDREDENYYVVFNSPALGRCGLIFSPNEQILKGMRPYLSQNIIREVFY